MRLAEEAVARLGLDRVFFVPTARTPLKDPRKLLPAPLRLGLLRQTLRGDRRFALSTVEMDRGGVSYTVDTLEYFRRKLPRSSVLYLLCGADALRSFGRWKDTERVLRLARVVALSRPGSRLPVDGRLIRLPIRALDVSSTQVREDLRKGRVDARRVAPQAARMLRRTVTRSDRKGIH